MRLLRRIPAIRRMLWQEWQAGYRAGFNARPLAEDIAKHHTLSAEEAAAKLSKVNEDTQQPATPTHCAYTHATYGRCALTTGHAGDHLLSCGWDVDAALRSDR